MNTEPIEDKRQHFRRYEDRRVALLLAIHEILFDTQAGEHRDRLLLEAVCKNFGVECAAFVIPPVADNGACRIDSTAGDWEQNFKGKFLCGEGFDQLWELQEEAPGALTLTRVKRPAAFPVHAWENLWSSFKMPASALLSVMLNRSVRDKNAMWLLQMSYSREWSSRDRQLSEEVAALLSRAFDKEEA